MSQATVSRRQAIFAGAAALVAPDLGASPRASTASQTSANANRSVHVLRPSSAEYSATLTDHFGSLESDTVFQQLMPATAILKNTGNVSVRAVTLTWTFTTPTGPYTTTKSYYFSPRFNKGGSPKSAAKGDAKRFSGAGKLVKQNNGIRLFSPFFSWSPGYAKSTKRPAWRKVLKLHTVNSFLSSQLKAATAVDVKMVTVIFGDRSMAGQDPAGLAERYSAQRNAQHDAGVSVLRMVHAHKSASEIASTLLKQTKGFQTDWKGQPVSRSNKEQFAYYSERTRHAKILLMRLIKGGLPSLTKTANFLQSRKKTVLTRLA